MGCLVVIFETIFGQKMVTLGSYLCYFQRQIGLKSRFLGLKNPKIDLALGMGNTRFFDKIPENLVFSTIFKHV